MSVIMMLVSLKILLDLKEELKRGVPPTVAIESKLASILRKASRVCCKYVFYIYIYSKISLLLVIVITHSI